MVDDGSPLAWTVFVAGLPRDKSALVGHLSVPHIVLWTSLDEDGPSGSTERLYASSDNVLPPTEPRLPVGIIPLLKRTNSSGYAGMVTFGRGPECDVVLGHPGVSKLHAFVRRLGDMWVITDAGSTNGTKVQGTKLTPNVGVELKSGNQIVLGRRVALEVLWPKDLVSRFRLG